MKTAKRRMAQALLPLLPFMLEAGPPAPRAPRHKTKSKQSVARKKKRNHQRRRRR